jgi:excisionase family DNA binding protein
MTSSRDELLTVEEVAKWLRVNPQTVRNWFDRSALGAIHVGARRVRIRQSELDRFIAAGETASGEEKPRESDTVTPTLAEVVRAIGAKDSAELVSTLRGFAAAAAKLADALEAQPQTTGDD